MENSGGLSLYDVMIFPIIPLLLSVIPCLIIVLLRRSVMQQRQGIIIDLGASLSEGGKIDDDIEGLPAFEIVKFKYFLKRIGGDVIEKLDHDFKVWQWFVAAIPLASFLFIVYTIALSLVASKDYIIFIPEVIDQKLKIILLTVVSVSGVQIFTNLFRSVNNFDLTPSSFLEGTISLIKSIIFAVVFYETADYLEKIYTQDTARNTLMSISVLMAFAAGLLPDVLGRNLVANSKLRGFKKQNESIFNIFEVTPTEVIDGIDSEIRAKLEDFHIHSVQNLATANPLMLFVETPYYVYQIVDWVSQAQLFVIFGVAKTVEFWKIGIRTIFDLERIALDKACAENNMLKCIGEIAFAEMIAADKNFAPDPNLTVALVRAQIEATHVRRLRQIVMKLDAAVGNCRRLPPVLLEPQIPTKIVA